MTAKKKKTLQKESIERLIEEEIDLALIEEGMVDWVKEKLSGAGAAVAAGWEKIAAQARKVFGGLTNQLSAMVQKLQTAQPKANAEYQQVVSAMQQGGGSAKAVPGYAEAMALSKVAPALSQEAAADKQQAVAAVQQAGQQSAPTTQGQTQATEAFVRDLGVMSLILREAVEEAELDEVLAESALLMEEPLDEAGVMGVIGIALATPKLIMWTTGLLSKLAGKFKSEKAQKVSEALKKAGHWVHHAEESLIDKAIPNKAAYLYYKAKTGAKKKLGIAGRSEKQAGVQTLSQEEFAENKKVRMITKLQMHKIMLLPFLIVGLTHIFHALHSVFSAADALATVAKTAEVGGELSSIASEAGSLTAAVAETDPTALLDITDVAGGGPPTGGA